MANIEISVVTLLFSITTGILGKAFAAFYLCPLAAKAPKYHTVIPSCLIWNSCTLLATNDVYAMLALGSIGSILITASFIDNAVMLLPDKLTLPAAGLAIAISSFLLGNTAAYIAGGILVGAGFLFLVAFFYEKVRKRQGLGMGDVKLMLSLGALTGPQGALHTITLGSILLLLWHCSSLLILKLRKKSNAVPPKSTTAIPFGPFLTLGGACIFLLQLIM